MKKRLNRSLGIILMLSMVACGGDSDKEEGKSLENDFTVAEKDLDFTNPKHVAFIAKQAIDFEKLDMAGKREKTIFREKESLAPYNGWVKGVEEGKVRALVKVADGKVDGPFVEWHKTDDGIGSLSKHYNGSKNLRHGLCRKWDESGQLSFEINYADGLFHGTNKEFYDDGNLTLEFVSNYEKGKLMQSVVYLPNGEKSTKYGVIDGDGEHPNKLYRRGYVVSGFKNPDGEWSMPGIKFTSPQNPKSVF